MDEKNKIEIYKTKDGQIQLDVFVDEETVWLTQANMVQLFQTSKQNVSLHINNIFKEGEIEKKGVVKDYLTTASDGKTYKVKYFNLDVIISVGYRVKSKRGTQFRIWANSILKDYVLNGYALNKKLLNEKQDKLKNLHYAVSVIDKLDKSNILTEDETHSLLNLLSKYVNALDVLDAYDHRTLKEKQDFTKDKYKLTKKDAVNVIKKLREKFNSSELFGREKDKSFESSVSNIYQTFEGKELYPGSERKAANLLYFLVKNHSFADGNKRIAAAIFLWFMYKNNLLFDEYGNKRIDDSALVGLTLMAAESNPKDKEQIINVILNLLN